MRRGLARLRPRTVRGRATLAVTAVTAVGLTVCVSVLLIAVHRELVSAARISTEQQVDSLAGQLRERPLSAGVTTIAVENGFTVIEELEGWQLQAYADPAEAARAKAEADAQAAASAETGEEGNDPVKVEVVTTGGRYVIQAQPDLSSARSAALTIQWLVIPGVPLILLLVAGLTWIAMGRALRPVEAIRVEFAEITSHDLHRRVPDPRAGDEVSRLAGTMNSTLNQLERAVLRLRTFAADASHELRSPLTTLRTRLELAVARPADADWPDTGRECLEDTEQLQVIVEDLLLLARLDAGQLQGRETIDVVDLLRQLSVENQDERPVVLEVGEVAVPVRGSRIALSRLLANLVDNATRHARTQVQVRSSVRSGRVVIEVADDGPGIPEADRLRVFDRFTQLGDARTPGRTGGGTGLGLAIARDIAAAHGGTLTAEAPDPGTTGARLVLTLPAL